MCFEAIVRPGTCLATGEITVHGVVPSRISVKTLKRLSQSSPDNEDVCGERYSQKYSFVVKNLSKS